ncbi:hypothetical protein Tco_1372941 [Tanacetum coccineum]
MEKKVTSSCSNSKEEEIQIMQEQARSMKERCMNSLTALKTNFQLLSKLHLYGSPIDRRFKRERLFGEEHNTFNSTLFHNMNNLENQPKRNIVREGFQVSLKCAQSAVYTESNGTVSDKGNECSSRNDCSKIGNDNRSGNESKRYGNESTRPENEYSYPRNESNDYGNDTDVDGANIRPSYDIEPTDKVPNNADYNVFVVEK